MKEIKTVFIDIDNTLLDFNKNAALAMERAFIKNGLKYKDEYAPVFLTINDGLWAKIETGELTRAELVERRFRLILGALNLVGDYDAIERDFRAGLSDCAEPVDGAMELLEYLSKKYDLYAASNAFLDQQKRRLDLAGMGGFFKDVFVSEKLGHKKPTKEYFDACFNLAVGANKESTAMIGDSLSADIEGGVNYGLMTVWLNRDGKSAREIKPHYTVTELLQIKNIL